MSLLVFVGEEEKRSALESFVSPRYAGAAAVAASFSEKKDDFSKGGPERNFVGKMQGVSATGK